MLRAIVFYRWLIIFKGLQNNYIATDVVVITVEGGWLPQLFDCELRTVTCLCFHHGLLHNKDADEPVTRVPGAHDDISLLVLLTLIQNSEGMVVVQF